MEGSALDIIVFAPLAPILGVILFWFIQLLFIEEEKYLIDKIREKHQPLCRFTNFLGVLFQTICHALGYTVTKSGISDFYLSVNYGKVAPKKEKEGVFEWVSNGFLFIGPFFIPACLLLIFLFFMMNDGFQIKTPEQLIDMKYTFSGQMNTFGSSLSNFTSNFFAFLFNIDLFHPPHIGFLFLMIFLGMGMRPSYIGEKKQEKVDMIYDLRNIWSLITHKPLYLIILFLGAYVFFYISLFLDQNWYVAVFSIFGWISIISIASILIANLILLLIKTTDEIDGFKKLLPYLTIPVAYILMRVLFVFLPNEFSNSVSIVVTIIITGLVAFLLLNQKTNKFKFKIPIKLFRKKKSKDGKDE